ncbi:hypothetical protein EAG_11131 [Camponotus floridanus]|uniref:Uncharacterized protein n=1 Tax=Camponotus floridanus TaxID=104421 RepID=E2A882_CAMFO|nr:hypothetical protein EAG_11131 [Camponotus floridanus]
MNFVECCSFNFGKDRIVLHYDEQRCRKEIRPQNNVATTYPLPFSGKNLLARKFFRRPYPRGPPSLGCRLRLSALLRLARLLSFFLCFSSNKTSSASVVATPVGEERDERKGRGGWDGGRYCKTYMRRGLAKPRRKKQLAPTRCICIGKQTAAGSLWLARKMNKIMKKKGKFRVEMQKSNGAGGERGQGGRTVAIYSMGTNHAFTCIQNVCLLKRGMEKWMAQTLNSYDIQHHYWLLHRTRISRTPFVSAMAREEGGGASPIASGCCEIYGTVIEIHVIFEDEKQRQNSMFSALEEEEETLECRRNKWSNHPPTLTIWRKQSSTAIHPYIVARTKSLATADLRYALYINQLPPAPPPRTTIHTPKVAVVHMRALENVLINDYPKRAHALSTLQIEDERVNPSIAMLLGEQERSYEALGKTVTRELVRGRDEDTAAAAAAGQVIDPSVHSREFGAASWPRRSIDPANPATRSTCAFARIKPTSYAHLPVHKSPKTRRAFRQLPAGAPDAQHAAVSRCDIKEAIPETVKIANRILKKPERIKDTTIAAMKMAGGPTLVEHKAAGGLGSESRGQSEPVGRARRQPQPQTERLRAASAPEHRPH